MKGPYADSKMVPVPVDALGKSIEDDLIYDVVTAALGAMPLLTPAYVLAAARVFNEDRDYAAALNMAAVALRFAQENKPRE